MRSWTTGVVFVVRVSPVRPLVLLVKAKGKKYEPVSVIPGMREWAFLFSVFDVLITKRCFVKKE